MHVTPPSRRTHARPGILMLTALIVAAAFAFASPARAESTKSQREATRDILQALRESAIDQILSAARSDESALRANAIEAIQPVPQRARPLAQLGLEDDNPAVRFSALVTIGRLKLDGLGQRAREMAQDTDGSVRAAALFAARRCGEAVDISPMAKMLASQNPTLRGNVAMLLGMLGDPSAVAMLKDLAEVPMQRASAVRQSIVRIQIAEALVKLGEDSALDAIRAGAYSQHDEVRVLSLKTMGRLEDERMTTAFRQMVKEDHPIELRLAAAEALGRIGAARETALAAARKGADWDKAVVRAQAAFTLGWLERPTAARRLGELLDQDEESSRAVRLAAAAAVLQALEGAGGAADRTD